MKPCDFMTKSTKSVGLIYSFYIYYENDRGSDGEYPSNMHPFCLFNANTEIPCVQWCKMLLERWNLLQKSQVFKTINLKM